MASKFQYLFGPVPSRRFGRSLGIDLTPYKTCSYDCVFCQLGQTTAKAIDRREYVPTQAVLKEIKDWLKTDGQADYITLSGSGEPTLHSGFGDILAYIGSNTDIPSLLLTNGSLLYLPEVRQAAAEASVVKASLSAWDQASLGWINRPHEQLVFKQLISGLKRFRNHYRGRLWMEVFLVAGMNSMPDDVRKIAALAKTIAPERIQLNTAVRPPAEEFVTPLAKERLVSLTDLFTPKAEIIAEFNTSRQTRLQVTQDTILEMLRRRPCTAQQIANGFDMHINEVLKYLGSLLRKDQVHTESMKNGVYYIADE
jgi:wyosine [tRNA(Phe)-imidazoG37] synthetase (radical SAM superfamily)